MHIKPILGTIGAALGVVLAEAAGVAADRGLGLPEGFSLKDLTAAGFVIWYSWYVTARAMPKRDRMFIDQINLERAEHTKDRDSFKCRAPGAPSPG